jgi:hypothetical protein
MRKYFKPKKTTGKDKPKALEAGKEQPKAVESKA